MVWDAFKSWFRGEYIAQIAARKRQSVQSLRQLEGQIALENLCVDGAKRVFKFGTKNGTLLAWLAKGQYMVTHIGRLKDLDG